MHSGFKICECESDDNIYKPNVRILCIPGFKYMSMDIICLPFAFIGCLCITRFLRGFYLWFNFIRCKCCGYKELYISFIY